MVPSRRWAMARQSVWYLALGLMVLLAIGALHYRGQVRAERAARLTGERLNVALGKTAIANLLEGVASDVAYLATHDQARGLFRPDDAAARAALAADFLAFVRHKKVYDQIRFLDLVGKERVRVNYDAGNPRIVPDRDLQDKADRYYVAEALRIGGGETYVSPFDLNVERGRVERPLKPVIRFGVPVLDDAGNRSGVLLFNYLGDRLLDRFRAATANVSEHAMLLNADGFWLSSPRPEEEWGFMRGRERTFATKHPAAWERLRAQDQGQFETASGVFTFATIHPEPEAGGDRRAGQAPGPGPWKVVTRVPSGALGPSPLAYVTRHWPLYSLLLALLTAGAALLGRATVRHRLAEGQIEFERHFREVLEKIDLGVVRVNPGGEVTFCNDAILGLVGWKREDLLGRDWIETVVAPQSRAEARATNTRLFDRQLLSGPYESWLLARDGERRLVAWNDAPVLGPAGHLAGLTLLGADITQARHAEQELQRLSQAVEQSPSTVMITDPEGRIEYVNPKFTELTGYTLDEVRGMNPRILKSGSTSPGEYEELWRTISAGGEWRGAFCNRKKNGESYWEAATISAVRNRDGTIASYVAVKEDITHRRRLEERFRHCVESAPSGMLLVNAAGEIMLVNREAERAFGYDRSELLGRPVEMLVPEAMRGEHVGHRDAFLPGSQSRAMGAGRDVYGQRRDGTVFPIEIGLHTIESEEGRIALATVVDITERRQLEDELAERNREIVRTEALTAVGRMANMVAHDLRNPLSSVKMGLQIMGKPTGGRWSEQELELREIALQQVRYMEEVLDDLLSYSRESELTPEWLQIDKLLDAAILLVQKPIDEHHVRIRTSYQTGLPTLHGDAARLRRAFYNLILNGVQATEGIAGRRPELTISTHLELAPDRPNIRVRICDNGSGIEADQRPRLFDPFFTTRAAGTGLGLAIVKRIVGQHGGSVSLEPGEISGTCVTMILPTGPMTEDPAAAPASRAPGEDRKATGAARGDLLPADE